MIGVKICRKISLKLCLHVNVKVPVSKCNINCNLSKIDKLSVIAHYDLEDNVEF